MAGGRRLSRGSVSSKPNLVYPLVSPLTEERVNVVYEMKHIRIPYLPRESPLIFELILCLHICLFTGLQFVHLYRTVWWLPQSFNSSGVNFHLIDFKVVGFIFLVLFRRVVYLILKRCLPHGVLWVLHYTLTVQLFLCTSLLTWNIWREKGSYLHLGYLFIPLGLHFYVNGFWIDGFWEIAEFDYPEQVPCIHICSNEATTIREQVDRLRADFNCRLRKVIATSCIVSYYSAFIPWCFAQPYVHYDLWFVSQHLVLCWLITFSLLLSRAFCPEFSDTLHKVACHLGKWTRLRPNHIPSQVWISENLFAPGSIVKHQRELYKAEGFLCVASEPGNQSHQRFQLLFTGSSFPRLLLGFHTSLIVFGFLILLRSTEWYQVISISSLVTTGLFTFIRLGRDYLTLLKIYQAERIIWNHSTNNPSSTTSMNT